MSLFILSTLLLVWLVEIKYLIELKYLNRQQNIIFLKIVVFSRNAVVRAFGR